MWTNTASGPSPQIELAEAELAILKQEGVLRDLLSTGAPTAEAIAQLVRLRELIEKIAARTERE